MLQNNVLHAKLLLDLLSEFPPEEYFCVSTDKAANPVNIMGASKRIMEDVIFSYSDKFPVKTARFANVAFSNGSLPAGFLARIQKLQPLSAPSDVRRYFVTPKEAGELCLLSGLKGDNKDIFFPKLDENLNLVTFSSIAQKYLENLGYEPVQCDTEQEARDRVSELKACHKYPVYFFESDTTGEKDFEEFYTDEEIPDMERFESIGIIKNDIVYDNDKLEAFEKRIDEMRTRGSWSRTEIIDLFNEMIPNFNHQETGKFLDGRM